MIPIQELIQIIQNPVQKRPVFANSYTIIGEAIGKCYDELEVIEDEIACCKEDPGNYRYYDVDDYYISPYLSGLYSQVEELKKTITNLNNLSDNV